MSKVKDALHELSQQDWRISEFLRMGKFYATHGDENMPAKCSSAINKWRTIALINHDRTLHGRDLLFRKPSGFESDVIINNCAFVQDENRCKFSTIYIGEKK